MSTAADPAPWELPLVTLDGRATTLGEWQGKVLLIVNVASQCGYTPQYAGLEALWRKHRSEGLVVLGVPCDQFGNQEPGGGAEILAFCQKQYGVTFPVLTKTEVNGEGAHPLYKWLKKARPGFLGTEAIKWNFTKFLVDQEGVVRERYGSIDTPEQIGEDLPAFLHQPFHFELHFTVRPEDIDRLGHVNNVVYVQWVQDVATAHWQGAARADHLVNVLWVLARHEIDYKVSAMPGDDIIARTWVGEPDGMRYPRHVELIRASDGKLLARSLTLWCPVDAKTLKILRPPPEELQEGFFHPPIRPV